MAYFGLRDGGADLVHDRFQVAAGHLVARTRGGHSATLLVSEHNQHGAVKMVHGVLDTAKSNRIGDISRSTYDEEIAETLIKNQIRRNPAVGASQDDGMRMLC